MEPWSILDKSEYPEEFANFVYHDEGRCNFAVKISNILTTNNLSAVPKFQSRIRIPYICIFFENNLIVFSDPSCEDVRLFKSFDSNISGLLIKNNEDKILVVLENGIIHLFDIATGADSYTKTSAAVGKFSKLIIYEQEDNKYVLAINSVVFHRLILIPQKEENSDNNLKYVISQIKYSELDWDIVSKMELVEKGLKPIHGSTLCMKSTVNKQILGVCPVTGQEIVLTDSISVDFLQTFENTDRFLFLKETSAENTELCIADLYNFNVEFSMAVSKECYIIGGIDDSAIYLDIKGNNVFIYHIKENSPLSQLEILIFARNYEGAEAFAKLNNLSPAAVLELKAKCLLNKLSKEFSEEVLSELKDILSTCENIDFILNCCLEGVESDIRLSALLELAKKHLSLVNCENLNEKLNELIWKTDTYKLFEYDNISSWLSWGDFINMSALSLLNKLVCDDRLDLACIVWSKCYPYIVHKLTQSNISDLLYSVPHETKLNSLLRWLEYILPNVVNIRPFNIDIVVNWAKERILLLENSKHWPEIGVQLSEKLIPLIFNVKVIVNFESIQAEKFYFLVHCIKNIQTLKNSYNIIITLKDFMTFSREDLAKLILRKAFAEDLDSLISNYLETYQVRHNINRDNLIKSHIEELINASSVLDESKMEILLGYIENIQDRLKCVLLVLKSASIPWSKTIYSIANSSLNWDHALSENIRIEIVHAEIKGILMKYKCHELSFEDYEYLCRRIIRKGDPDMITDIEKITNVYTSLRDDTYLMCILNYLQRFQVKSALELFNKMKEDFKAVCIDSILLKLENLLLSNKMNEELEFTYLDFLKSLDSYNNTFVLDNLHNIYILKNKFNVKISLNEYSIEECRNYSLNKWCKEKYSHIKKDQNLIKETLVLSIRVGYYLKISKTDSISTLFKYMDESSSKIIASLIFKGDSAILDSDIKSMEIVITLLPHIDFNDLNIISNVSKHITNILQYCDYMNLSPIYIDICSWIMVLYYAHNSVKEVLSSWKITSFYNPHVISSMVPVWKDIISNNAQSHFTKSSFCLCKSDSCTNGSVCLKKLLSSLQTQQNDMHFSRISAHFIMDCLKNNSSCPSWFHELHETMIKTLVSKMLSFEKPDNLNISILLFSFNSTVEWLSDMVSGLNDNHRKMNIAQYILQCKDMFQNVNIPYKQAFNLFSNNKISSILEKYSISSKEYQQENYTQNINSLLKSLVNATSLNTSILEEFCLITEISLDQALTYYLFSLLKNWNNSYEIIKDAYRNNNINIKIAKSDMFQKSLSIIEKIECKKDLVENLTTLFKHAEINFQNLTTINLTQYSYEVFLFILDLLKYITGKQMFVKEFLMLKFLQTYQRVNKPTQTEMDVYSIKETFPKIGYYRLPFQPLISSDCWTSLKSELSLTTYERWLSVASLLTLEVSLQEKCDMICSSAVRGSMANKKSLNETNNTKWSLNLQNEFLLKKAHRCIQNITNLEWAGACFYLTYQGSSSGADQVTAANMCYQFAEHWSKIQPNNILKKMQSKHLLTSTAHVLHKIGLADEKLLALCDNPHLLIEALFNHESILTYTECPNINAAVDEISRINDLDVSCIRINILERILNQTSSQLFQNNLNIKSCSVDDGTLTKENVIKVCYILKGTNPMMAASYLSRIGLEESDSLENYNNRIRALQCLLSLADSDVIEMVTSQSIVNLWSKVWELYFINSLCTMGLEFLTAIFLESKTQAIHQIWNAREHNQSTILLLIKIIVMYDVVLEEKILDEIIKSMIKFGMFVEIRDFLSSTRAYYSQSFVEGWSNVLLNPFKRLDVPITANQKDNCISTLRLLPACPVLPHIDMTTIWYQCIKLHLPEIASVVLPHVKDSERGKIVSKIGKIQHSLLQDIKSLKSKGIITADIVIAVLKSQFKKK